MRQKGTGQRGEVRPLRPWCDQVPGGRGAGLRQVPCPLATGTGSSLDLRETAQGDSRQGKGEEGHSQWPGVCEATQPP